MKKLISILLLFVAVGIHAQQLQLFVTVTNTWDKPKADEPVVLSLKDVIRSDFKVKSAQVIADGSNIRCQLDDLDGDTYPDELMFLIDLKPHQKAVCTVTLSATSSEPLPTVRPRVYADMMLEDKKSKYPLITSLEAPGSSYIYNDLYHHGAAFESELTGYRIYFDQRQNIDLYGKKVKRLELADTHFYTTPAQMSQDYGNDVLWAGKSVGCGSFKGWDGKSPTNIEPVDIRGQRIISAGPLRTIVEVKDLGWNGRNMYQRYIMYAGHRECEVQVRFDRPLHADELFCTGVQKIGTDNTEVRSEGWTRHDGIAASWGCDYPEMGKKEQFPPETVGLAIYVPQQYIKAEKTDELNYLFILGGEGQTSLHYYVSFCADKEKDGYHTADEWFSMLNSWKEGLQHPAEVKVRNKE